MGEKVKIRGYFRCFFAITFIVLTLGVFFFWCSNCTSIITEKLQEAEVKEVKWDETKEYPKDNTKNSEGTKTDKSKKQTGGIGAKIDKIKDTVTGIMKSCDIYMPGVKVKKIFDRYIYRFDANTSTNGTSYNPIYARRAFISLGEGYWGFVEGSGVPIEKKAQIIVDFANQQKSEGRDFIFFETTERCSTVPEEYEAIYGDHFYEKYNASMKYLKDNGVDCLSTTEIIDNSGIDRKELFFKTDHHWLPQVGLWMTREFAEKLNKEYGYNIDVSKLDIDSYDVTICELPNFGSIGIKNTEVYSEYDYMPILMPKYDSNLTVEIPEMGYSKTGKLQDTIYDNDVFSEDPYDSKYAFYAFSDKKLVKIKNNNLHNGKRILVIKKSMANVITPFMSDMAEYIDVIDLRYFNGSLQNFIEKTNPDMVVVIYSASDFGNDDDDSVGASYNFMD